MKKRILSCLLIFTLSFALLTGCGNNSSDDADAKDEGTNSGFVAVSAKDSTELLSQIWASYDESEKFPIGGGDYDNTVMDTPGAFNISKVEDLDAILGMPADGAVLIDDAASMMHMMNANTFTAGAYHVNSYENVKLLADLLKENILNRQWMCGFPDTLIIIGVGEEYVISAFGNAEVIETFKEKTQQTQPLSHVIYEESLSQ